MALGKQKYEDKNTTAYSVSFKKDKKTGKSAFQVSKRQENGKFEVVDTVSDLSGSIIKIEQKVTEWEGKKIESVLVTLKDTTETGSELYFVSFPFGIATRSLFNAMLSLKSFDNISIGTYMTRPKKEGDKSYPAIALRQNGEIIRWKFELKDLPAVKEITFKGEKMRDYTDTDKFFVDQLTELNKQIHVKKEVVVATPTAPVVEVADSDKDIPF